MSSKQWQWHLQPLSPFAKHTDESGTTHQNHNKESKYNKEASTLLKPLPLPGNFGREELLRPLSKLCPICSLYNHRTKDKKSPRNIKVVKRAASLCSICQSIQSLAKFIPRQNFLSFINADTISNHSVDAQQNSSRLVLELPGKNLSRLVRVTSSSNHGGAISDALDAAGSSGGPKFEIFHGDVISLLCSSKAGYGGGTANKQRHLANMVPLVQFRVIKVSDSVYTSGNPSEQDDTRIVADSAMLESRSVSVSLLMDKGGMQHDILDQYEEAQEQAGQESTTKNLDSESNGMKMVTANNVGVDNVAVKTIKIDQHTMENVKKADDATAACYNNAYEKTHTQQNINLKRGKEGHTDESSSSSSSEDEHLWSSGGFLKTRTTEEKKTVARGNYFRDVKAKYRSNKSQKQEETQECSEIIKSNTKKSTVSYKQEDAASSCMESINNNGSKCEETEEEESESAPLTLPSQFMASYSKSFDSTEKQQSPSCHDIPQKSNHSLGKRTHHDDSKNSPGQAGDIAATKTPKKSNVSNNITNIQSTNKARDVPFSSLSYNQLQQLHKDSIPAATDQPPVSASFRHTLLSLTLALTSNASSYDSNFLRRCKKQKKSEEGADEYVGDSSRNDEEKQRQQWMPRLLQGTKLKLFDKNGLDTEDV